MADAVPASAGQERALEIESAAGIESVGVDRIPEEAQTATPWTIVFFLMGGNVSFSVVLYGWIPILFGLGVWSSVSAVVVGTLIVLPLLVPMLLSGSRAGTNASTCSGAYFGVRGRLIGSLIGAFIAIVFLTITIWVGVDTSVGASARLFDTPSTDLVRGIGYAVVTAAVVVTAIWGFRVLARLEAIITVGGTILLGLAFVAFAGNFDSSYHGGSYLLGDFTKTWILTVVLVGVSGPLSLITVVSDWTRYISPARYPARRLLPPALISIFLTLVVLSFLGTFIAVGLGPQFAEFGEGLVATSPRWYLVPILILGIVGSIGGTSYVLYSFGLDLDAIVPQLSRVTATTIAAVVCVICVYATAFLFEARDSVTALASVFIVLAVPWATIVGAGFVLSKGRFQPDDLQVFNRRTRGGRYWYTAGWNLRAVAGWTAGACFGLLAISTSLYDGPLADLASGIDVSLLGSGGVALVVYLALRALFPERGEDPVEGVAEAAVGAAPEATQP